MKIGIDARLWGVKHTGIGRYVEQLVTNLKDIDRKNEYVLFLRKVDIDSVEVPQNWKKVIVDIQHYSLTEQLLLPFIFSKEKLDLLHVPHYNVPMFYGGKFLITIHDLTWHNFKGVRATTLSWPLYSIKYLAYRIVVNRAIKNAAKIITPSFAVKDELMKKFNLPNNKVEVTYEAVFPKETLKTVESQKATEPYLLYVGNLYPHKNIQNLVRAVKRYHDLNHDIKLVIVCARNIFSDRLQGFLEKEKINGLVEVKSSVTDQKLSELYKYAKAFTFPSLSEGFGLPGLEAMQRECPVICSDIPVFREIYKDAALYFNPKDEKDIASKVETVLKDESLRNDLVSRGLKLVKQFSWSKMAKETLAIYENGTGV